MIQTHTRSGLCQDVGKLFSSFTKINRIGIGGSSADAEPELYGNGKGKLLKLCWTGTWIFRWLRLTTEY